MRANYASTLHPGAPTTGLQVSSIDMGPGKEDLFAQRAHTMAHI